MPDRYEIHLDLAEPDDPEWLQRLGDLGVTQEFAGYSIGCPTFSLRGPRESLIQVIREYWMDDQEEVDREVSIMRKL